MLRTDFICSKILRNNRLQFRDGFLRPDLALGHDGVLERGMTRPVWFGGNLRNGAGDDGLGGLRIFHKSGHDHFHGHVRFIFFPANSTFGRGMHGQFRQPFRPVEAVSGV